MAVPMLTDDSGRAIRRFNRRELLRGGAFLTVTGLVAGRAVPARAFGARVPGEQIPPRASSDAGIYESIGVRPMINCRGVNTYIGGSLMLPEVKRAMEAASQHFVDLNELADGIGKRLAELTGAEWGIVTSGCAAAMTHATSACIAGTDPEKIQRLPDLTGLQNEVIIPRYCRNVYDHAIRMLGVRIIEPENKEEYQAAFTPRTAMVYVLGPNRPGFDLEAIAGIARQKRVPVLVDAAAERLTVPNEYLERGATMVCYSGGKVLRGPQCAGLLLGPKNLVRAAWYNGAPHHSFGRSMKVGKEEMMGMLAAVEMWMKRDHDAERRQMQSWCEHIASTVSGVSGVRPEVTSSEGRVSPSPRLQISWDHAQLRITAIEVHQLLLNEEPRIVIPRPGGRRDGEGESIRVSPIMMSPGDERAVAERLYAILSDPPRTARPVTNEPTAEVSGQWTARLRFVYGEADHTLVFEQEGAEIRGTHQGPFLSGDLRGYVDGSTIRFRSSHKYEGTYINYEFTGTVRGENIEGTMDDMSTIDRGEFGEAEWSAHRYQYTDPRGVLLRPTKTG